MVKLHSNFRLWPPPLFSNLQNILIIMMKQEKAIEKQFQFHPFCPNNRKFLFFHSLLLPFLLFPENLLIWLIAPRFKSEWNRSRQPLTARKREKLTKVNLFLSSSFFSFFLLLLLYWESGNRFRNRVGWIPTILGKREGHRSWKGIKNANKRTRDLKAGKDERKGVWVSLRKI